MADLKAAISRKKAVAVIDQNISIGKGGILHSEIASCLYNEKHRPLLLSFIAGLGGKNISPDEFEFIINKIVTGVDTEDAGTAQLIYTDKEWQEMGRLKRMAGKG